MKKIENIRKMTELIAKHPVSFVAGVFFCMFWATYFIHIRREENEVEFWRELYLKEKDEKDEFRKELMIKAGIIEKQNAIIKQKDTILRNETEKQVEKINKITNE